jgi:hypothetical protein
MSNIKVIDNFLELDFADWIESEMVRGDFHWHYYEEIAQYTEKVVFEDKRIVNPNGFVHVMYNNGQGATSQYFNKIAYPILKQAEKTLETKINQILRIRTRMTIPIPGYTENNFSPPHVDLRDINISYKTLVYYVNDSDGDFILFNEKHNNEIEKNLSNFKFTETTRVSPKKNRAIFFDGHTYHSGNAPINNKYRIVVNIDFTI